MNTINQIADAAFENAKAHGFHDRMGEETEFEFLCRNICLLHEETSELWQAARAGTLHEPCDKSEKMIAAGLPTLTCAEEEYADIVIRCLDQCRRLGIDIERAIDIKHRFNVTRPFKHGGKKA